CAAIVRDKEAMDSLLKFPVSLMRKCSSTNAESEYLFTELIQSVYLNEPSEQFEQKLVKVLKCAAEEEEDPWVLYCTGAKLNFIMAAYMTNNETTPTQSMSNALTQYWDYHERHTDHGYQQPDFYMPIALLGLACLAKDNGEQVDVRSDFIPQFYIDGDYL
ncbi:MAG: immunity 49 family protein, partial [Alteromonadales bacterium]|nr:immunity 49 family protein [Alteromonadales bacterium]